MHLKALFYMLVLPALGKKAKDLYSKEERAYREGQLTEANKYAVAQRNDMNFYASQFNQEVKTIKNTLATKIKTGLSRQEKNAMDNGVQRLWQLRQNMLNIRNGIRNRLIAALSTKKFEAIVINLRQTRARVIQGTISSILNLDKPLFQETVLDDDYPEFKQQKYNEFLVAATLLNQLDDNLNEKTPIIYDITKVLNSMTKK